MNEIKEEKAAEEAVRFLIYQVGEEPYASPLLSIREVLEYQKPKFMPNMARHFSGVINVRGSIVGAVDLRIKFGCAEEIQKRAAMLLCDTKAGPIAAIVDGVDSVMQLRDEDFEKKPPVKSRTEQKYLLGVAKNQNRLIVLIDLHGLLFEDELKAA